MNISKLFFIQILTFLLVQLAFSAEQTTNPNQAAQSSTTPAIAAAAALPASDALLPEKPIETITTTNDKISFYFQNIDLRTLLQLIAKTSGLNFIISEAIKGNITLNLKDVTWQEALDIIMESHGLSSRRIGNAIFVSTTEEITQNETKQMQSEQDILNVAPLKSQMIGLKYTDAATLAKELKGPEGSLLTPRGEITIDPPTNSIIIRDISPNLAEVVRFIKKLDKPARQVSIEARIVDVDTRYEAQLGVKFGISNTRSLSGTFDGANQLAQGVGVANVVPPEQRLNFNLPGSSLSTGPNPASIALALARLGPVLLDLELSALEEEGHSQIISRPRVVTANQQKATIQTGEEIPYQQATSSGATSIEFKKAVLSLEIVPQITPDDKILLKLKATQDSRGPQLIVTPATTNGTINVPATFGPPTIDTQEVQSYVMLNNNETVVVGGIYKITNTNTIDRVPFFSSLPIVGNLFKHNAIKNEKRELLIFITPKIIKTGPRRFAYKGD